MDTGELKLYTDKLKSLHILTPKEIKTLEAEYTFRIWAEALVARANAFPQKCLPAPNVPSIPIPKNPMKPLGL